MLFRVLFYRGPFFRGSFFRELSFWGPFFRGFFSQGLFSTFLQIVYQFVNNFSALLLCKINVLVFFDTGHFFQIFVISRNTEILIESNFWLGMYSPCILNHSETRVKDILCFFSLYFYPLVNDILVMRRRRGVFVLIVDHEML